MARLRGTNQLMSLGTILEKAILTPPSECAASDAFVVGYRDKIEILSQQRRWFSSPERTLIDGLNEYMAFKLVQLKAVNGRGHP